MAHQHHHNQLEKRDVSTIVSVIYVTAAPTFSGAIGGYITLDGDSSTVSAAANTAAGTPLQSSRAASSNGNGVAKGTPMQATRSPSSTADSAAAASSSKSGAPSRQQRPDASTTSVSTATLVPSSASDAAQTSILSSSVVSVPTSAALIQATTLVSSVLPAIAAVSSTAPAIPSATASPVADANEGTTTGAKAGIAIGVILALAVLAGLILFMVRRSKRKSNDTQPNYDHEKSTVTATVKRVSSSSTNSSRFSLARSVLSIPRLSMGPIMSEKQDRSDALNNPFGDHAESRSPITDSQINGFTGAQMPIPLNLKADRPISPNPAPAAPPANVHRVQLDFKPSMDDELELRTGTIVRLLHEYDDGWALCKSFDRSQQGVVPRSCLSKHPLKPRNPPQARGQGARQASGHRNVSNGSVSSNTSYASEDSVPRPLSPAGRARAQSQVSLTPSKADGEQSRQRANSTGDAAKAPLSPLNPAAAASGAVLSRKPVPGQAI